MLGITLAWKNWQLLIEDKARKLIEANEKEFMGDLKNEIDTIEDVIG